MFRSMMSGTDLPISFWGYALEIAAFLLNRIPSKAVDKTPYELWTGTRPGLSFLKIWGCEAYVKRQAFDKLASKSDKCLFVGYPRKQKGTTFTSHLRTKCLLLVMEFFLEREFISKRVSGSKTSLEEVKEPQVATEPSMEILQDLQPVVESTSSAQGPRRSSRIHHEPKRYGFLVTADKTIKLVDQDEPTTYNEAMMSPDSKKLPQAMKSEMQSMYDNQAWNLVDPPKGAKAIGCKWVHKIKHYMTFKSRLVAKGFKQTHSIDYDETFSPIIMLKSIRILLAITVYYDYEIWQMEVKTTFLNGNLLEDVYMTQPEGFVDTKYPNRECKLQRSIYGLKQASRS